MLFYKEMKTILVVDDDKLILELTAAFLDNLSSRLTILTAENGAEAIYALKTRKVDLVLTDINMPVIDGFKLLTYISDKHPDIKAIAMTGLQTADIYEKLHSLGVRHCMEKPFSLKDLNDIIIQILDNDSEKPVPAYAAPLEPAFIRQVF